MVVGSHLTLLLIPREFSASGGSAFNVYGLMLLELQIGRVCTFVRSEGDQNEGVSDSVDSVECAGPSFERL
jgi:hypothetical protein